MYTDDYSEELENEEDSSYKQTSSNPENKVNTKLIIVFVLLLVIIGLVIFILKGKQGSASNSYTLTVIPDVITVPLGKNQSIAYDVRKGGVIVPNAVVNITLENENIANVDNTIITGLNYGRTKLIATYTADNGKTYQTSKDVIVADGDPSVHVTGVTFPDGDLQMPLNGTYDITLTILPPSGYVESKIITSSNTNVVTVSSTGTLTAVSEGTSVVTIDINNGMFKKDINVYVSKENVVSTVTTKATAITLSTSVKSLNVGETATIKYTISPSNASKSNIKWKSSNTSVLTVDSNGKVKAIKEGTATITVTTSNNISDSISIKVNDKAKQISAIDFPMKELALLVGHSQLITPTISPADATNKKLTYTSSNTSVVKVTPSSDTLSATIQAVGAGEAVVTIKSDNGVEKKINIIAIG